MTPKVEDTGKYTIDIGGVSSTAFLNVDEPDPVYSFVKMLKKKHEGFTDHDTTLECAVSSNMAIVSWFKGTTKLEDGDVYSISKELSGICKLTIKNCKLTDTGDYSCRIEKQTDRTDTKLHIIGKRNLLICITSQVVSFLIISHELVMSPRHCSAPYSNLNENCLDEFCLVTFLCVVATVSLIIC